MKPLNTLLLASVIALGFALNSTTQADDPLLSPSAAGLRSDLRIVLSTGTRPSHVSINYPRAVGRQELVRAKVVPCVTAALNLVSGNYPGAGLMNPFPKSCSLETAALVQGRYPGSAVEADCTLL